jgi:hypothetical protein
MKIYFYILKCVFCWGLLLLCQKSVAQLPDAPTHCELALTVDHLDSCTNGNAVAVTILSDERCGPFIVDFGDGTTMTTHYPVVEHNYLTAGTYTLTLNYALYSPGPRGPATQTWTVNAVAYSVFFVDTFNLCYPEKYTFSNRSNCIAYNGDTSSHNTTYIWDYGDGSPLDTTFSGLHAYYTNFDTTYTVTLYARVRGVLVGTHSRTVNPWDEIKNSFTKIRADKAPFKLCYGQSLNLATLPGAPGYGDFARCQYQASWTPQNMFADPSKVLPTMMATIPGTHALQLELKTPDNIVIWRDTIYLEVTPQLSWEPTGNPQRQIFCANAPQPWTILPWQEPIGGFDSLPLKYTWSGAVNASTGIPVFTGTTPGDYIITNQVSSGSCTITSTQYVTLVPPHPVTAYDFTYTNGCNDGDITFAVTGSPLSVAYSYDWDFGDYKPATLQTPTLTIPSQSIAGTRLVTLKITTACGQVYTVKKPITIAPTSGVSNGYNKDCCANVLVSYDYNDFTPTGSLTWNTPKRVKGTITVDSGIVFTITNTKIYFGLKGRIIVKQGGQLVVSNSILTGAETPSINCYTMWEGIEVWGNPDKKHLPSDQPYQGRVTISASSEIRQAHKALFVGRRNDCYPTPDAVCAQSRIVKDYIDGYGGGLINVQNSTFSSNAVDIQFTPYVPVSGPSNMSVMTNNNFNGGTLYDPSYSANSQGFIRKYPNAGDPYYSPATTAGQTYANIMLRGVKGIQVKDNRFTNTEYGINSYNAAFNVTNNTSDFGNEFYGMRYGIFAVYAGTGINYGQTIDGNSFNRMSKAAIRIDGGKYTHIKNNSFGDQNLQTQQAVNSKGIYLDNTSYFNITDNFFYRLDTAVQIINSATEGGQINSDPRGNEFIRCRKGVVTSLDNSNLQIRCATFNNAQPVDYANRNWSIAGLLPNQGTTGDHTKPSGNELTPAERKDIFSSAMFTYYRHAQSIDGTQSVTPTIADGSAAWGILNTGYLKQSNSCVPPPPCSPHCDLLMQQNQDRQDELAEMYQHIITNLDGRAGTAELLTQINNFTYTSEQLKDLLIENSPLSDIVIAALIENHNKLAQQHLMIVCNRNFPVSADLWELMQEVLPSLSTGTAEYIRALQLDNPDFPTLTSLERAYLEAINERQGYLEEQAEEDIYQEDPEAAATRLLAEEKANQQTAVETYIAQGNISAAQDAINSARIEGAADEDWRDIASMLTELLLGGENIWNMSEQQELLIRRIATTNDHHDRAAIQAQAILFALYGEEFAMQGQTHPRITARRGLGIKQVQDIQTRLMPAYPNPASEVVNVPYYALGAGEMLSLTDLSGRIIRTFKVEKGYNLLTIPADQYEPGFYFITLRDARQGIIATQKIIIHK